jgi:hypothetical protein
MTVHINLNAASPTTAATWHRWTKLHFRELLSLPPDPVAGKITHALAFAESDSHNKSNSGIPFFNTVLADDVSFWKTALYKSNSKRLDLENTRELSEGEVRVGCEEGDMVWDLVAAEFSIYEEVEDENTGEGARSFQYLPSARTSRLGDVEKRSWLVGLSAADVQAIKQVRTSVLERLEGSGAKTYSSLYKNAGLDWQPDMHPRIGGEKVGGAEWLALVLVVDEEGKMGNGYVEGLLKKEVEEARYGVWDSKVIMA